MPGNYPYYQIVSGPTLEQGDMFNACPIISPLRQLSYPLRDGEEIVELKTLDVVIMTQSCDLAHDKVEDVILCPHWSLSEVEKVDKSLQDRNKKESIRRGNQPGYHMLPSFEKADMRIDIRIVSFRNVFSLPKTFVSQFAEKQGNRLRLLPPYREHLSQAFARFFMRVGLPQEIELP